MRYYSVEDGVKTAKTSAVCLVLTKMFVIHFVKLLNLSFDIKIYHLLVLIKMM